MSTQGGNLTGREIAGNRLLHVLGTGGASEVYLAQNLDDPTALVAVKVLMPSWQLPPDERKNFHARFLREAQAAQRLNHPHILPVLVYGEEDGITFMVLPFMAGGTLATRLGNAPHGLPLAAVAKYLELIAGALDFAHEHGVIHRDIKPTNVLVDAHDQLYLSDFGIARLFTADESAVTAGGQPATTLTVTGQILGTPVYMAPEQVLSARVGPAADIYSLGILLYQMVTGVVPFEAETSVGLAMLHVQEPPAAPHLRRVDLPPPAEAAILRAIAKSPEARF
ncbi:MAG TPA: serine/threonine-protein kinase [Ktedonobacterales bacterium]|jgi:serine/threonine protein kinase